MDKDTWADRPSQDRIPVAATGYPLIFLSAFVTLVFALLGFTILSVLGLATTAFILSFFRDPDRWIPDDENAVVSPADGKIISIAAVDGNPFEQTPCTRISIFMSVFNVHVNRIPHEGRVLKIHYDEGKFFSANLDKASESNERNAVLVETEKGTQICFVQIAGLIARRIICGLKPGDEVVRGRRFGMIRFGSRLDVYVPADFKPVLSVGEHVRAGGSILGYLQEDAA